MPFTPFHFGAGALVHSVAPMHVSFLAFCGANVLVDVEPHLTARAVALGALTGTYSHVLLDSMMHPDMKPFAPLRHRRAKI
jgi:membrane-bound metal-dependent hydrolase YbcI (DUF457 family)